MKKSLVILIVLVASLARVPAAAPAQGGNRQYTKDGLTFDYPVAWTAAENSSADLQRILLTRNGASNLIMVFAQREPVTSAAQLYQSRNDVTLPYITSIARRLGLKEPPATNESQCIAVGDKFAVGFRMTGQLEKMPTTAEVYTVVLGQRLLHLVNIRADKDDAEAATAWKTLLDSLKVDPPANPSPEAERIDKIVMGGVLNGKAIKKPAPDYPASAKMARAMGTVTVQLLVDEEGKVAEAYAVSGHPLLQGASVEAARRARFTPTTLCGKPVKVTGVITYNFVLR